MYIKKGFNYINGFSENDDTIINWPMILYLSIIHYTAYLGILSLIDISWKTLLFSIILWIVSGLGITAGAHRLWSHRSYNSNWYYRLILMIFNSIANQGSIYHWCRDHRVHHKYSETNADPHNAKRGFFYSHIGWLMIKKNNNVIEAGKKLDFSDLKDDNIVMFQKNFDPYFSLFMCFLFPAYISKYFLKDDFWSSLLVAGCLRYCIVLHFTWLVNSAAHLYGNRPYDPGLNPSENPIVSIASLGEGWHNWHHKYPYDYAASEFGITKQFNPTKLFIDFCALFGFVYNRKRSTNAWLRQRKVRYDEIYKKK